MSEKYIPELKDKIEVLKKHGYFEVTEEFKEWYLNKYWENYSKSTKKITAEKLKKFIFVRKIGEEVLFYSKGYIEKESIEDLIKKPYWLK